MPKLSQYFAPKTRIQPSERGYQAYETAGRRIGGMYAETARSEMESAKLAGDIAYNAVAYPALVNSLNPSSSASTKVVTAAGPSDLFSLNPKKMPDLSAANTAASGALEGTSSGTRGAIPDSGGKVVGGTDSGVTVLRGGGTTALDKYTQTVGQLLANSPSYTPPALQSTGYWSGRDTAPLDASVTGTTYGTGLSTPSGTSSTYVPAATGYESGLPSLNTTSVGSSDTTTANDAANAVDNSTWAPGL